MNQKTHGGADILTVSGHSVSLINLRAALLTWWRESGRSFPWRSTTNAYQILMAEMMLRRTQARQVVPVYVRFISQYPDARSLANAAASEVSDALYSLGLSWRVPAFQQLARVLVDQYDGNVPADYHTLIRLPGVGDYVAAAVCSFAYDLPYIIADTNTVRVAGRIYGISTHAESRRRKPIRGLLKAFLDHHHPRQFNYALLDLAALICTPSDPECSICPLNLLCKTGQGRLRV